MYRLRCVGGSKGTFEKGVSKDGLEGVVPPLLNRVASNTVGAEALLYRHPMVT